MANAAAASIDAYIAQQRAEIQPILTKWRTEIHQMVPEATEKISWAMPTFWLNGNLVHFAAHQNHVGFYPGAEGIENFIPKLEELGIPYSKGGAQFPYKKEVPWDLIREIVLVRRGQQLDKK